MVLSQGEMSRRRVHLDEDILLIGLVLFLSCILRGIGFPFASLLTLGHSLPLWTPNHNHLLRVLILFGLADVRDACIF